MNRSGLQHLRDLQSGSGIADHVKYSLCYLKLRQCRVELNRRIQSICNRKLIQEELSVLQLQLAGLHSSLSKFNIADIRLNCCICVVYNSKLHRETLEFEDLQITQNTASHC